jgi:DUF917 family protein
MGQGVAAMWTVAAADLERLAIGAGILGTGGGGNPYLGKLQARRMIAAHGPVRVVALEDVPDDAVVTSVGGMGSPTVGFERIRQGEEELLALRALEQHTGRRMTHLVVSEIGGSNAMRPIAVAAMTGLPVIDGDGMGRAFPELQMDTFSIYGIPPTPAALADHFGHITLFDQISDATVLERYARAVTIQMGGAAGYAMPVMSGADVRRTAIPGTVTLAARIGEAVLAARAGLADPIAAVLAVSGGRRLLTGKVVDVERRLEGGFARGEVRIDGLGDDQGRQVRIDVQNENLIAREGNAVLAVVPDLICLVDADTAEPITTEVLRYGLRVAVLGLPAPSQLQTPAALAVVGPGAFGYDDVAYVPLADLLNA